MFTGHSQLQQPTLSGVCFSQGSTGLLRWPTLSLELSFSLNRSTSYLSPGLSLNFFLRWDIKNQSFMRSCLVSLAHWGHLQRSYTQCLWPDFQARHSCADTWVGGPRAEASPDTQFKTAAASHVQGCWARIWDPEPEHHRCSTLCELRPFPTDWWPRKAPRRPSGLSRKHALSPLFD